MRITCRVIWHTSENTIDYLAQLTLALDHLQDHKPSGLRVLFILFALSYPICQHANGRRRPNLDFSPQNSAVQVIFNHIHTDLSEELSEKAPNSEFVVYSAY